MEILREDGKIKVQSEFNRDFIREAKQIQGKWDAPYWVFPEKVADRLDKVLIDVYGEGFQEVPKVEIEIDLDTFRKDGDDLTYKGLTIATRRYRDSSVILKYDAYVTEGNFLSRGGSTKYPEVTWADGTKLRVSVPETLTKELPQGVTLVQEKSEKQKLLEEKERLLKRIAEIDELLK